MQNSVSISSKNTVFSYTDEDDPDKKTIFTFDENTTYLFTAVVYESREDFLNNASFWIV